MSQLNNNQIQFLREKLQKEVRLYIEMDDKIKRRVDELWPDLGIDLPE